MASKKLMHNTDREFSAVTESGTKYEFSKPDDDGWRTVSRKAKGEGDTAIFTPKPEGMGQQVHSTDRKEFTGKLKNDVQKGLSLYVEIKDENRTLVSEKVMKFST